MATILIFNQQSDLLLDCSDLPDAVNFILKFHRHSAGELAFHFVCSEDMIQLHKEYFGDDGLTDCIGFPLTFENKLLGDIFVCPKTAVEYAQQHKIDPYQEVMRYVIHALLHFLGYEDHSHLACIEMRFQEDLTLENVEKRGYLLSPSGPQLQTQSTALL